MVAIPAMVIASGVLYVMVSGLLVGPGAEPRVLTATISRSPDGANWTLLIASAPRPLTVASSHLAVFGTEGQPALPATPFASLSYANHGAAFNGDNDPIVEAGESLLISTTRYPTGSLVRISDGAGILFARTLS